MPAPSTPATGSAGPLSNLGRAIRDHLLLLFVMLGVMWVVEILDFLPYVNLDQFGIRPRSVSGLIGIPVAPFLHDGFMHLIANSVPFVILGGVVLLGGVAVFWRVTIFVILASGLAVWAVAGGTTNHIGASGLIFGYLGFLLARGWFEKSIVWSVVALVILFLYSGLVFGILLIKPGVSWQGHLFGFLAGIAAARLMFPSGKRMLQAAPAA